MKGSLPRRYARALIEIAQEEKRVDVFGEELQGLLQVFEKFPGYLDTLASDSFDMAERLAAVQEIADKAACHPLLRNFLLLLIKKDRFGLLPDVGREYQRFQDEILGIVRIKVTAPKAPEKPVLNEIEKVLSRKLKKKVISAGETDPAIIGGLLLEIDHTIYDGSVRRELERMREMMLKG